VRELVNDDSPRGDLDVSDESMFDVGIYFSSQTEGEIWSTYRDSRTLEWNPRKLLLFN
jgi:hypothetical protein